MEVQRTPRKLLLALGVAALVHLAGGLALLQFIGIQLLEREGGIAQQFLESFVKSEKINGATFMAADTDPLFKAFAAYTVNLPDTMRATIYSTDGFIRHSTEASFIGLRFDDNPELDASLNGQLILEYQNDAVDKSEHLALNLPQGITVIEAYIPVRDAAGTVVGVVEYYKLPLAYEAAMSRIRLVVLIIGLISCAAMGALLGWMAVKGVGRGGR